MTTRQGQTNNLTVSRQSRSILTVNPNTQENGVRKFFNTTLPHLVESKSAAFSTLQGSICFRIRTVDNWTLDLGNVDSPVQSAINPDADLVLSFTATAFSEFLDGTLDISERLSAGEIAYDGDVQLLEKFGWFMQSTRDLLTIRD